MHVDAYEYLYSSLGHYQTNVLNFTAWCAKIEIFADVLLLTTACVCYLNWKPVDPPPPPPPNRQMGEAGLNTLIEVTKYHVQGSPEHKNVPMTN